MPWTSDSTRNLIKAAWRAVPAILFLAALWVLTREIHSINAAHVWSELWSISAFQWASALVLTACGYAVLTLYDVIGLRLVGARLPYKAAATGAFLSFSISNNVGLGWISGGSMRHRVYGPLGLSLADTARLTVLNSLTFFIGGFVLVGAALMFEPQVLTSLLPLPRAAAQLVGAGLWAASAVYVIFCARRRTPIGWRKIRLPVPSATTALTQMALSSADILLAAATLYVLLPGASDLSFPMLAGIYLLALTASVLTHVPGGLGVLETTIFLSLPDMPKASLLAALIAYRAVYYFLPLTIALVFLSGPTALRFGRHALGIVRGLRPLAPLLAAAVSLASGLYLLMSGATPALDSRIEALRRVVPLPLLELSHLAGSIAGIALVVLGGALYRRYDSARNVAAVLLLAGAATTLLHGEGTIAALVLMAAAAALKVSAAEFYRKGSLWRNAVTVRWIAAGLLALCVSVWLGLSSYADVPYSSDLWWQFAYEDNAPRFLRASLVVGLLGLGLLSARLLGPARGAWFADEVSPSIVAAVEACPGTEANLALLSDKRFLHSQSGESFLMYQVEGRSWIAMGDPVGRGGEWPELVWRFREAADVAGARPVFYETLGDGLDLYIDAGLVAHKIGEEARVDLAAFDMALPSSKSFRASLRRGERAELTFEILPAAKVASMLDELEQVSREWLTAKHSPEKGFSVGAFERGYLARYDCAVVRHQGRIVAFANVWLGANRYEASIDLMRHGDAAPSGTMMFLTLNLMLWAQQAGYRWFNLGMAPLAGLTRHRLAPKWHAIGRIVFRHGERLYGFGGLRHYKAQFHPDWRPRYIVCPPGALTLALALADCVRLISRPMASLERAPSTARAAASSRNPSPNPVRPLSAHLPGERGLLGRPSHEAIKIIPARASEPGEAISAAA